VAADRLPGARKAGLTFVEVVVTLTVAGALAAVVFRSLAGHNDRQRAVETVAVMHQLRLSIWRFDSAVGRFPGRIRHLHTAIAGTDTTICNNVLFGGKTAGNWTSNARGGPFYEYATAVTGFATPVGQVSDTLLRNPTTASNDDRSFGLLQIVVRNVTTDDVSEVNFIVDRDNSSTGGAVRWTADGSGTNTMTWNLPIPGC
jgi:type II secretory pathway pseudopilin PulG